MTPTEINEKVHTVNRPEFERFKAMAKNEPMCNGWTVVSEMAGWTTISVPNWTAGIPEFCNRTEAPIEEIKFIEPQTKWFESINPVVAARKGLTAP
jgi:hypothetical protein